MFQNVLMTALTPLCKMDEIRSWENRPFTTVWPEAQQQPISGKEMITTTITKKKKRNRTAFTTEQLHVLETTYARHKYIDGESRKRLASKIKLEDRCIKIWFQNRRMKEKRDYYESSLESSSDGRSSVASPPSNRKLDEMYETIKVEEPIGVNIKSQNGNHQEIVAPPAYELPQYYHYYPQFYTEQPSNSFYHDTNNVYSTQYYPVGTEHHQAQCPQYNGWPANMFDVGSYYST